MFLAPLIVFYLDERKSMWLGALCYWCAPRYIGVCHEPAGSITDSRVFSIYIASLVKIVPAVVYIASVIIGFGSYQYCECRGPLYITHYKRAQILCLHAYAPHRRRHSVGRSGGIHHPLL